MNDVNLLEYLPDYLKNVSELKRICATEDEEMQIVEQIHDKLVDVCFLSSCSKTGIRRYEKMLKVIPLESDTLEDRRFRLLSKWNNAIPYNYAYLVQQLILLCGENGYKLVLDIEKYTMTVKVALISKNMMESVKALLEQVVPCNILLEVGLLYNTYQFLEAYTYEQLGTYTYGDLREEVLI